jgi:hypothetical protein
MFYMIGGPGDIAYANAQKDYERIADNIPVVMLNSKDGLAAPITRSMAATMPRLW